MTEDKNNNKKELTDEQLNKVEGGNTGTKATYKCEYCNQIFTSKLLLKAHKNKKHSTAI